MIFITLRNNRKLSHSWFENFRKSFFGGIIVASILLMIIALDIPKTQFDPSDAEYNIKHLPALFLSMFSMPLTMFSLLAMNKNSYVKLRYKFMFEIMYMLASLTLATVFYLRIISVLMIQVSFVATSAISILGAFLFGLIHIRYKATTMYGKLVVKPISYDGISKYILISVFISLGFIFQAGNILYYKFVSIDIPNFLLYQIMIQTASVVFFLLNISIFTASRSLGQSQEVLYYRFAQLLIMSTIFLLIGLGVYRTFTDINSTRELIDNIFIGVNVIPALVLFGDLWMNHKRIKKDKNYQGFTEMRLLIKILSAIIAVLVNLIVSSEIKFFVDGQASANIDLTITALAIILIMIAVPFFLFWKKITKRSSRIITTLIFLILAFALYKFYFYAVAASTLTSTIFWIPVGSIYTMVTLLAVLSILVVTVVLQAKSSGRSFGRYSIVNADKEVNNGQK